MIFCKFYVFYFFPHWKVVFRNFPLEITFSIFQRPFPCFPSVFCDRGKSVPLCTCIYCRLLSHSTRNTHMHICRPNAIYSTKCISWNKGVGMRGGQLEEKMPKAGFFLNPIQPYLMQIWHTYPTKADLSLDSLSRKPDNDTYAICPPCNLSPHVHHI